MIKCQRLPTSQAVTHDNCLGPEVDDLLHATRRFQCCDTFGRQTGTAQEGCETVNAAKLFQDNTFEYL